MNDLQKKLQQDWPLFWGMKAAKYFLIFVLSVATACMLSQFIPSLLIKNGKELGFSQDTGSVGDTIGGTLGPFVAMIAAGLTYMAFKIQYDANIQQQKDLAKERFENKFFEMLRLHKECLNEIVIPSIIPSFVTTQRTTASGVMEFEETTSRISSEIKGREVFISLYEELVASYNICKEALHFEDFSTPEQKRAYTIKASYIMCFSGINNNGVTKIDSDVADDFRLLQEIRKHLEKARVAQMSSTSRGDYFMYLFPNSNIRIKLPMRFNLFSGHVERLGHYYRNLFLMVKFVARQESHLLSYDDKREYLRILRAQLSTNEQLMLYFNYLSGYGSPWENKTNKFFSDYRMIHNLPFDLTRFASDPKFVFKDEIARIEKTGSKMFEYDE